MDEAAQRRALAQLAPKAQHDANNMLTVLLATVEMMRNGTAPGDATARRLDRLEQAAKRLEALLRGFLTLSRAQQGEVDVALLLHRLSPALRLAMAGPAALEVEAPADGVRAVCDTGALGAALVACLSGAEQARLRLTAEGIVAEVPGRDGLLVAF